MRGGAAAGAHSMRPSLNTGVMTVMSGRCDPPASCGWLDASTSPGRRPSAAPSPSGPQKCVCTPGRSRRSPRRCAARSAVARTGRHRAAQAPGAGAHLELDGCGHGAQVHGQVRRVGDQRARGVEERAAEVQALLDVDADGGALQDAAHLLRNAHEPAPQLRSCLRRAAQAELHHPSRLVPLLAGPPYAATPQAAWAPRLARHMQSSNKTAWDLYCTSALREACRAESAPRSHVASA